MAATRTWAGDRAAAGHRSVGRTGRGAARSQLGVLGGGRQSLPARRLRPHTPTLVLFSRHFRDPISGKSEGSRSPTSLKDAATTRQLPEQASLGALLRALYLQLLAQAGSRPPGPSAEPSSSQVFSAPSRLPRSRLDVGVTAPLPRLLAG